MLSDMRTSLCISLLLVAVVTQNLAIDKFIKDYLTSLITGPDRAGSHSLLGTVDVVNFQSIS
jgi:hypothetical protein